MGRVFLLYVCWFLIAVPAAVAQATSPTTPPAVPPVDVMRLVLDYNDALDRCTRSGCSNIDELMSFFADDAVRHFVGQEPQVGKATIRNGYRRRAETLEQTVKVQGVEMWGDLVICRIERHDTTMREASVQHHLRVFLTKEGKIKQLLVITDPTEDARLRR